MSKVKFKGVLKSPKHSIPWATETFIKITPGGLESGEKAKWEVSLPSDWKYIDYHRDAVLTVTTNQLWVIDEEIAFPHDSFDEWKEKELKQLKVY